MSPILTGLRRAFRAKEIVIIRITLTILATGVSGGLIWQSFYSLRQGRDALAAFSLLAVGVVIVSGVALVLFRESSKPKAN